MLVNRRATPWVRHIEGTGKVPGGDWIWPGESMRAYILSIGSELIGGHLTDTNATYLAQELAAEGVELLHVIQVGDDLERLTRTLANAATEADLIICTGGIGPTDDDMTREAIAALAGESPTVDEDVVEGIRQFFALRGLDMPARNAKQAWMIPSAEALPNPVGTAPGWLARIGTTAIVAMPGVPREMFRMWQEQALPRLKEQFGGAVFRSLNFRTLGVGESAVSELLGEMTQSTSPYIGTYAKDDGVHVRITASAPTAEEAEAILSRTAAEVRSRLGDFVYSEDERPLPKVLIDQLLAHHLTIAVAEVGSGGRFASLMLTEPSADRVLRTATVVPAHGSPDAQEAAQTIAAKAASDVGIGIVAIAAPTALGLFEGTIEIAVTGAVGGSGSFPIRAAFPEIQRRSAMHAADVLRRAVMEREVSPRRR